MFVRSVRFLRCATTSQMSIFSWRNPTSLPLWARRASRGSPAIELWSSSLCSPAIGCAICLWRFLPFWHPRCASSCTAESMTSSATVRHTQRHTQRAQRGCSRTQQSIPSPSLPADPVLPSGSLLCFFSAGYGGLAWTNALVWPGQEQFVNAQNTTWISTDNQIGGSARTYGGFTFLRVKDAGHMVSSGERREDSEGDALPRRCTSRSVSFVCLLVSLSGSSEPASARP